MILGKRKNNHFKSFIDPLPKRLKCSLNDYFLELDKIFKKIKLEHDKECKISLEIVNNCVVSHFYVDNKQINPYFLDFY